MRRIPAAAASAAFFVVSPGVEAGLAPWALTGWEVGDGLPTAAPVRLAGALLIAAGLAVLVHAFARFVRDGDGTPSPLAPPARLVVGGPYRHVRHPMYLATAVVVAGEGLLLAQPVLLAGAAALWAALALFGRLVEEPLLRRRHGAEYEAYRRAVPAWRPRLRLRAGSDTTRTSTRAGRVGAASDRKSRTAPS